MAWRDMTPEERRAAIDRMNAFEEELRARHGGSGLGHYILENGRPKAVPLGDWAAWMEETGATGDSPHKRQVDFTRMRRGDAVLDVSTVFLGLDHGMGGVPLLYETMVFAVNDDDRDLMQWRYSRVGDAKAGHWEVVDSFQEEGFQIEDLLEVRDDGAT